MWQGVWNWWFHRQLGHGQIEPCITVTNEIILWYQLSVKTETYIVRLLGFEGDTVRRDELDEGGEFVWDFEIITKEQRAASPSNIVLVVWYVGVA